MEISFHTRELRQICEIQSIAEAIYSKLVAETLRKRIADILAVENCFELPLGNPRILHIKNDECLILDMCSGVFLQFIPAHKNIPRLPCGQTNWQRIFRIKLIKIGQKNASN